MTKLIYLTILFLINTSKIYAQDGAASGWCGSLFKSKAYGCGDRVRSNSVGGSFPLLFDAFNVNSATLPTYPTPLGVETSISGGNANFSLIKGIDDIGFGSSVSQTKNTFFSSQSNLETTLVEEQVQGESAGESNDDNLKFGTSYALFGKKGSWFQLSLGLSGVYDQNTSKIDFETGLVLKSKILSLGYSFVEKNSGEKVTGLSAGLKLSYFYFDYTYFEAKKNESTVTTRIFSANFATGGLQISYAFRKQENSIVTEQVKDAFKSLGIKYDEVHTMLGASYRFSNKISVGFFTNYDLNDGGAFTIQYLF